MAIVQGHVFRNRKHPAASLPPIFYYLTSFEFTRPGITLRLFCFDSSRISASIRSMDIGVELSDLPSVAGDQLASTYPYHVHARK